MGNCCNNNFKKLKHNPRQTKIIFAGKQFPPVDAQDDEIVDIFVNQDLGPEQREYAKEEQMNQIYCRVGFIVFERKETKEVYYATGFLIQNNLVLTSAHTFFHRDILTRKAFECTPIKFCYQLHGKFSSKNQYQVDDFRLNEIYQATIMKSQGKDFDMKQRVVKSIIPHDYALIKLKTSVRSFQPPRILCNYQINDRYSPDKCAMIYGYSENHLIREFPKNAIVGAQIVGLQKEITNIQDGYLNHNIQTSKCQSGSPIFLKRVNADKDVQTFLVGIHSGYFLTKNHEKYGALITQSFIQSLKMWQNQLVLESQTKEFNIYKLKPNSKKLEEIQVVKQVSSIKQQSSVKQQPINSSQVIKEQQMIFRVGLILHEQVGSKELVYSTGFLIQDNLVLTSAHTFFHRDSLTRKVFKRTPIKFCYQLHGTFSSNNQYQVEDYRLDEIYQGIIMKSKDNDFDLTQKVVKSIIPHDYALIKLKTSVKSFRPPKILCNYQINDRYSPDKCAMIYGYSENHLIRDSLKETIVGAQIVCYQNEITNIQDGYLNHNILTSKCQAGSPIFLKRMNVDKDVQIFLVGIHSGYFLTKNHEKYGALITQSFIQSLKMWQNQLAPESQTKEFNIYKLKPNSKKLEEVQVVEQVSSIMQQSPVKQVSIKQIGNVKDYREFNIKFDLKIRESEYYQVTDEGQQQIIKRTKDLPFENKPFHFTSKNFIPQGKWFISLCVSKFSEEPIIVGFMNHFRKKQQQWSGYLEQKYCVSLCLQKNKRKREVVANILSEGVVLQRIQIKPYQEKRSIKIFINMDEKIIVWVLNALNVYSCPIPENVCKDGMIFFVGLNDKAEEIIILRQNRR